jgi:hypothetical protein
VDRTDDKTARERISARGEDALTDIAQLLADNPVLNQVLQAAFGARDIATSATGQALKNLNVASASDLDRLARRLRSISDRLEVVEDRLDGLAREIAAIRTNSPPAAPSPPSIDKDRLGLSE